MFPFEICQFLLTWASLQHQFERQRVALPGDYEEEPRHLLLCVCFGRLFDGRRPLRLRQQLVVVHATEVKEASDADVEVADCPMRDALTLVELPGLQVLFGYLRWVR